MRGRRIDEESRMHAVRMSGVLRSYRTADPEECNFIATKLNNTNAQVKAVNATGPEGISSDCVQN